MKKTLIALSLLLCLSLVACGSSPEDGSTTPEAPKPNTPQVEAEQEHEIITKELIEETIRGLEFPVEQKVIDGVNHIQKVEIIEFFEQGEYKCWEEHEVKVSNAVIRKIKTENLSYTVKASENEEYFTVDCTAVLYGTRSKTKEVLTRKTAQEVKFSLIFSKSKELKEAQFPEQRPLVVPVEKIDYENLVQYFKDEEYHYWDTNTVEKSTSGGVGFVYGRERIATKDITNIEVVSAEFADPEMSETAVHVIVEVGSQKFQGEIVISDDLGEWIVYTVQDLFLIKEDAI